MKTTSICKFILGTVVLALAAACGTVPSISDRSSTRTPMKVGNEAFTAADLVTGTHATQALCEAAPGRIWAQIEGGEAECISYWYSGLQGSSGRVLIFFSGDLLAGDVLLDKEYPTLTPTKMQERADSTATELGVPYMIVGRPGTFGSTGEHKQRRRALESRLMSAALDGIKRRHELKELVIAGQSGGGHVVASLLNYRTDLICAVASSAVASPKMRWIQKGWKADATGYSDSYEPTEHLGKVGLNRRLRVFVIGDPTDSNVPWSTQTVLVDRLKAVGASVEVLHGEGAGSSHHGLARSARAVASKCLLDQSTPQIIEFAAAGLKG